MEIEIKTNSYNSRRYSKPWIAKVNFASNPKGDFSFGHFVGDDGAAGFVMITDAWTGSVDPAYKIEKDLWAQIADERAQEPVDRGY